MKFDYVARFVPEDNVILVPAFDGKFAKYNDYVKKSRIAASDPYVIAINGAGVPYSELDNDDIPYILSTVLPFGGHYVLIDKTTRDIVAQGINIALEFPRKAARSSLRPTSTTPRLRESVLFFTRERRFGPSRPSSLDTCSISFTIRSRPILFPAVSCP